MSSQAITLSTEHQATLLKVAADSIEHGLHRHKALAVTPESYPRELRAPAAVFVTLTLRDELRGCVGILEANAPVVVNVAKHAYAAAFSDTRFSPLARSEFPHIRIKISILSELEPIAFQSEQELLAQIRQGVDGLLLEEGPYRGTLLPSVWEDIPEPCDFLRRLKQKAGLSANYWSNTLTVKRYTTFCFG